MPFFKKLKKAGFDVVALHHAQAVLERDMPAAVREIEQVLLALTIPVTELVSGGGGEAKHAQRKRSCSLR